jgi:UDP-N-acetylmuramyl tripeptide synthase
VLAALLLAAVLLDATALAVAALEAPAPWPPQATITAAQVIGSTRLSAGRQLGKILDRIAANASSHVPELPRVTSEHDHARLPVSRWEPDVTAALMIASPTAPEHSLFERVWLEGRLEEHLEAVYSAGSVPVLATCPAETSPLTYTKLAVARAAGRVSRAAGRGGGTTAPGRLLLRMAPRAIGTLAARLADGVILVSGTNGKTTTARMLASILEAAGRVVVHNRAGANTHWGVATALADGGGDLGVFEVDEAWLPLLATELRPRLIVMGNLSRDRLDGYGELERLVDLWRSLLSGPAAPPAVVANADDPLLAGPGGVLEQTPAQRVLFGIDDDDVGTSTPEHPHEAHTCAVCGQPLRYTRAYVGHLGHYGCAHCRRSRPAPAVRATAIAQRGLEGTRARLVLPAAQFEVGLAQAGLHNVHNALAAAAAADSLGVSPAAIRIGLESVLPPFGRSETVEVHRRRVHICLVKNPAGVNATLTLLRGDRRQHPLHLWLALNDGLADGRDVSWIWDADFERLAGFLGVVTCSGRRASELALRLKYAGWQCPMEVDESLEASFEQAVKRAPRSLIVLPTYTALLGLRPVLNRRGVTVSDWGTTARSSK